MISLKPMKNTISLLMLGFALVSCARVGSPVGGAKDSLAPKLVKSNIDTTRINVPTDLKQLRLYFDEYITLKEVHKNLIISPPIKYKKIIPASLGNKFILIEWDETLQPNTTYNFNFGNSIADLNEGNVLPYFNFVFSTGSELDDTYISGTVKSGYTFPKEKNDAKKNFIVGLYKASDSVDYTKKPYYITKADEDGYFELSHLAKGKYRIIAFDDTDQNSIFTAGKDEVFFKTEDLDLRENISNMQIRTLPSKKPLKFSEYKEVAGGFLFKFEGQPESISLTSETELLKEYKSVHKKFSDSAMLWFDDKQLNLPETNINIGLKIKYQADTLKGSASPYYKASVKTEFGLSNNTGASLPPTGKFYIDANRPITELNTEKWILKQDSINTQPFTAKIVENHPHKIEISSNFISGKKYELNIPKESVSTYYLKLPKTYQFNFEIDKPENYGSLEMRLKTKPDAPFWMQLLNEQDEVKYTQFTEAGTIKFNVLKPDKYYVRILVDNNRNGIWDEADFKNQTPAEEVFIYDKMIEIRPLWENIEDQWSIK